MLLPQELIRKKRDGGELRAAEIAAFVEGVTAGHVTDGQIAALAMAVFFRDMNLMERVALTCAMRDSGHTLQWQGLGLDGPIVDKHSTGGVGDLTSLLLGPMVAACGGFVPMISGRGLGHTGGTLDKLDAIPGYNTAPDIGCFQRVVREAGVAIIGQTAQLAPADKRIYAVRDVTATVESVAMITASILSKKLAAGLEALVMDVKVGSGAFMRTLEKSVELAESIVHVGNGAGMKTAALLTDMNQALAPCAGNAIEVRCAIDYLTGTRRPRRLHEVTMGLASRMLVSSGLAPDETAARGRLQQALDTGQAAERFARMVAALGGPAGLLDAPDRHLAAAPAVAPAKATRSGYLHRVDCRGLGLTVVGLGGGRLRPDEDIDYTVGLTDLAELGQPIEAGEPLTMVHACTDHAAERAVASVLTACQISDSPPEPLPLVYWEIGCESSS